MKCLKLQSRHRFIAIGWNEQEVVFEKAQSLAKRHYV